MPYADALKVQLGDQSISLKLTSSLLSKMDFLPDDKIFSMSALHWDTIPTVLEQDLRDALDLSSETILERSIGDEGKNLKYFPQSSGCSFQFSFHTTCIGRRRSSVRISSDFIPSGWACTSFTSISVGFTSSKKTISSHLDRSPAPQL